MQQIRDKKTRRGFGQPTAPAAGGAGLLAATSKLSAAVSRSCALEGKKVFAEQKENWQ